MNVSILHNNFSAGEVSPLTMGRVDTAVYNQGARIFKNEIVMLNGGSRKRPGTWFDGYTKNDAKARLLSFQLSTGDYVTVEFTNLNARFWTSSYVRFGVPLDLATPYTEADLPFIRGAVSQNVLWLVHPLYPPQCITWTGTTFTITVPTFTGTTFNSAGNYPSCVSFYSGRLAFAATLNKLDSIWFSMAPDSTTGDARYLNFTIGANAADAIHLKERDMYGSTIRWIATNRLFLSGTDRTLWCDTGEVLTPSSADMKIVSFGGSASVQGIGSKDVTVYIGRDGKSLHALVFNTSSSNTETFIDVDISKDHEHLFAPGVVDVVVMDNPLPIIWLVLADGSLVSCTLDFRSGVVGYGHHELSGGLVESASIGPGTEGDILFLSVNRSGVRAIEHLFLDDLITSEWNESHYVDSGIRFYSATSTVTITGLDHLIGETVSGMADGAFISGKTVQEGGTVTLDEPVSLVHIGLPIESKLSPTRPELPANGTSQGKKLRIEKGTLRLYRSYGGEMGTDENKLMPIDDYRHFNEYKFGDPPEPFTGDIEVTVSGQIESQGLFYVVHKDPCPFTILGLILRIAPMET